MFSLHNNTFQMSWLHTKKVEPTIPHKAQLEKKNTIGSDHSPTIKTAIKHLLRYDMLVNEKSNVGWSHKMQNTKYRHHAQLNLSREIIKLTKKVSGDFLPFGVYFLHRRIASTLPKNECVLYGSTGYKRYVHFVLLNFYAVLVLGECY